MQVELLTSKEFLQEQENQAVRAMLICHANEDRQIVNQEALTRIIKNKHFSVLEHIKLTYRIEGLSRACLQELARHRHLTLSVESTRHTLRKQFDDDKALNLNTEYFSSIFGEYAKENSVILEAGQALGLVSWLLEKYPKMPNDTLKYFLPEFWPTKLIMSVNIRALRDILNLRTSPAALKEFRVLCHALFNAVPDEFKYLLEDCVHD